MRFQDKVAVVTGAGSGIGRATALLLAREDARVLVVDINPSAAGETVQLISRAGGTGLASVTDVSDPAAVRAAVGLAVQHWKQIDILVNNAAMMTFDPVVSLAESAWDRVLAVNLKSAFLFSKYAIPHMPPGSAIVSTSSVHAHETEAGVAPYAASKAGLEAFTRALALECAPRNIRVNCLAPGAINTPMLWDNPNVESGLEKVAGAVGQPEDMANCIAFLASAEARFINGATLVADGARLDIL